MLANIKEWLRNSPFWKTLIFFFSVIISGILCSGFITEITVEGKLQWKIFYQTTTFYFILIFICAVFIYNIVLYNSDKEIIKFSDNDFCKAYVRSQYLPEMTKKYGKLIKEGKSLEELKEIQASIEEIVE